MPKMIFVNLPVKDLAAATRFYEAIGCSKNEQFSDHQASNMVWSDAIFFHLLTRDFFATFTPKPVTEAQKASEMLIALTMDSREEVDAIVEAAAAAGGKADPRPPTDMGWLYNRAFEDPDGHIFEAVWVDMAAATASGE
ncbi:VOC family protein [Rhizobium leguminosarum]|uniref:VOC family protein n=1 Tax=Rhizobium leguminosarum TaxID=384 RepID=UPI00144182F7|nr:VOC family protein [Rhizobium leguminosarum]MBY5820301.1 lactoylglutathione lyase [Rhizobium leguminosarum]NKL80386.1 lactoylglutathione lyase [Rhizobium leguminosarum bv. viciae]